MRKALRTASPERTTRSCCKSWGGATIAYRRRLIDSPSYTLNHEEVAKALEEGIVFAEGLTPTRIEVDKFGHASAVTFQDGIQLPARSVLIAAGTQPNTVLAREEGVGLELDGKYFLATDENGAPVKPERHTAKPKSPEVLLHRYPDGRFMSFFGDLHPSFFGNVVKAMGSAKQGYPVVSQGSGEPRCRVYLAGRCEVPGQAQSRSARGGPRSAAPDADDRRGGAARAGRGAALRARPVLSHAEFRGAGAARAGHHARDGRPRAHRRLGRPREGPDLGDRARDGRLGRPARLPAARRAGDPDGPDRHADRDSARRDGGAGGRRPGQRRAVLHRPGAARRAAPRSSISPATSSSPTATASTTSRPLPTWWSGAATRRPDSSARRPQDRAFVGNIVQAMLAYASGALGAQPIPFRAHRPHHRHRLRPHDGRRGAARHGVLKKYPEAKTTSPSARSTSRCNA